MKNLIAKTIVVLTACAALLSAQTAGSWYYADENYYQNYYQNQPCYNNTQTYYTYQTGYACYNNYQYRISGYTPGYVNGYAPTYATYAASSYMPYYTSPTTYYVPPVVQQTVQQVTVWGRVIQTNGYTLMLQDARNIVYTVDFSNARLMYNSQQTYVNLMSGDQITVVGQQYSTNLNTSPRITAQTINKIVPVVLPYQNYYNNGYNYNNYNYNSGYNYNGYNNYNSYNYNDPYYYNNNYNYNSGTLPYGY